MSARLSTAAIGLPILVLIVWIGGLWFTALVVVTASIATAEVSRIEKQWGDRPFTLAAVFVAAALIIVAYVLSNFFDEIRGWDIVVTIGGIAAITWLIFRPREHYPSFVLVATASAVFYPGGFLFLAPLLRSVEKGWEWVLFLLVVTFATDTFAFFVGRAIGRRPLAPSVSPSKTLEGSVGGILGAVVAAFGAKHAFSLDANVVQVLALGGLIGAIGQLGDLAESRLKRIAGVKDSGWVVPGHGGILDRLDSLVFNLVVVYYFVIWIIQ